MKKVGLITYYGDNYGGVLQAYALQQMVIANGFVCELISNDFLYRVTGKKIVKGKIINLLAAVKHPFGYFSKRKEYHKQKDKNALRAKKFQAFRQKHLAIHKTGYTSYQEYLDAPPVYDIYLCGSDQIWNPNLYSENGFYFAEFAPRNALRIAYASSVGVSSVSQRQAAFMAAHLNRMDIISTREQKGADVIRAISGKNATVVLDPTLLLDGDHWKSIAAPRMIEEPYVFCYLFGEREYVADVKQKIKAMTGMKVVSIPFVARELSSDDELVFDAGPAEFISLIQHASLVLTDSFHATAFSINMKTPFVSLCRFQKTERISMNDRLHTILNTVDLHHRLIDEDDEITSDFLYDIDFEKAHILLEQKRKIDLQFLTDALHYEKAGKKDENM